MKLINSPIILSTYVYNSNIFKDTKYKTQIEILQDPKV